MISRIFCALAFFGFCLGLVSCSEPPESINTGAQLEKEIAAIDAHLATSSQPVIKDPSGVRWVITKLGSHLPALLSDSIVVDYEGRLFSDGAVFDDRSATFLLSSLYVQGWKIAFTKLPKGSEATLYIPSYYAYHNMRQEGNGSTAIPAYSTLVFDIKFLNTLQTPAYLTKFKSDTTAIRTYLNSKAIEAVTDTSGVSYEITTLGTGPKPSWYDRVKVSYSLRLLTDDTKQLITLDREPQDLFNSFVVDYLQGMKVGLLNMPEGSKARLYVPSSLGFGAGGATDGYGQTIIPANANIIIDLELKSIL